MNLNNIPRMDTHAHSEYSNIRLLDSINKIPQMMKTAYRLGMKGLILTDHECLGGHVKWLQTEKQLKDSGELPQDFKAALGNEIYLVDNREKIEKYWHFILAAKSAEGHRALRELSSKAWYHSFSSRGMTRVPTEKKELEEIVKKYPNSLIATNACLGGFLGNRVVKLVDSERRGEMEEVLKCKKEIDEFMRWNIDLFGDDFYVEIAAGTSKEQVKFNQRIGMIAKAYGRRIIIGSDSHYLTAKERPIHKAYLNSKEGDREVDEFYFDAHMMDNEEAFGNINNIFTEEEFKDMCDASMEIYDKIEYYTLEHSPIIPEIAVAAKAKTYNEDLSKYPTISYLLSSSNEQELYWINECLTKLKEFDLWNETYLRRIETEADIIKTVGDKLNEVLFKYFNTFQHYINLFWECGSIVGPGRGSAVCFLSNYLLGITQLDPVVEELPEWRFLNKERVELPD